MVIAVLKTIVTVITMIIVAIITGIQMLVQLASDLASQAKAATPGTVSVLKEQAGAAGVSGQILTQKAFTDIRKIFKIPEKEKVSSN